ncbi:MAG: fused acetyl/propionyl-CoA carboxylase subunit alpha/methylmalonyl-CoA decarboxylase subunit alpha [Nitriliruptor sp.]|nr:MAG: fused acetyl/propionyl-CoA carboxylase subunit alpha/methylmalonyl-CoA decarboxylase subunit alpha [Nitriliruptor sp.]
MTRRSAVDGEHTTGGPLTRLAIITWGAPAARQIRAAREHAREHGRALRLIAIHTDAERDALFVRVADEAVSLGDGERAVSKDRSLSAATFDLDLIERALVRSQVDAAWAGWGPLAQDPGFAELCDALGVHTVGPSAAVLRRLADPEALADLAAEAGVAVAEPTKHRGFVRRHLDVLAVADDRGTAWAVDVHDGTLQRRTEKVLVESATEARAGTDLAALRATAERLLTLSGFAGAGTVTFVRPDQRRQAALLRISVGVPLGHGITERTTGLDLAKLQLHLAEGGRLEGMPPKSRGHAISVRLNAEDAEAALSPAPGRIELFQLPSGPGIRIDTGVTEGDDLAVHADPTIAEVVGWGRDREEARVRLHLALTNLSIAMDGGTTNKGFLLDLLERPELLTGSYDTGWIDRVALAGDLGGAQHADLALLVAAVDAADTEERFAQAQLFSSAARGRPRVPSGAGRTIELVHHGHDYAIEVLRTGRRQYQLSVDGATATLTVNRLGPFQSRVEVGSRSVSVVSTVHGGDHLVEVDGVPHRLRRRDGGVVRAPSPGVVVSVPVSAGDEVRAGDTVAVLESMKMERAVTAPFDGRVRHVLSGTNVQVDAGGPLVELDPVSPPSRRIGQARPAVVPRLTLPELPEPQPDDPGRRRLEELAQLRRFVQGFELAPASARTIAARTGDGDVGSSKVLAAEIEVLETFADLRALFRSHREADELVDDPLLVRSPEEHLHAYMRTIDAGGEGLPGRFLADLDRALRWYGVEDRERTPELEAALYWIFRAQREVTDHVPVVVALLQRWYDQGLAAAGNLAEEARAVLDRLVVATVRSQPQVADLAREVRYRAFEAVAVHDAELEDQRSMARHLRALQRTDLHPAARTRHLEAMLTHPTPLAPLLLAQLAEDPDGDGELILDVLTRRYYRLGVDTPLTVHAGGRIVHGVLDEDGVAIHTIVGRAPLSELGELVSEALALRAAHPGAQVVRLDVNTWADELPPDYDALAEFVGAAFAPLADLEGLEHATATAVQRGTPGHAAQLRHVTFRPTGEGGLEEDRSLRGLQPIIAQRLELWRYEHFDLTRLPAGPGVQLYHAVARSTPSDVRLFAIAEVRTLTPVLDGRGKIERFVELEWAATRVFEAMRSALSTMPARSQPVWNRVILHVWPELELDPDELAHMADALAPSAAGLGLERVDVGCRRRDPATGEVRPRLLRLARSVDAGFTITETDPPPEPLQPLDEYGQKVVRCRRRGTPYPYELVQLLSARGAGGLAEITGGSFVEHELEDGRLVPVERPPGQNPSGIVVGLLTNTSQRHPEGMTRVVLLGDPTRALGAITEAECNRINAALDLAEERSIPLEWFALSAGARIALDSGTENMDGVAAVLRRLIEFTQGGGEVNVIVTGINVGAQPYWNAEATMLMHTKGILVMTPDSAMVLTGKQALDFSGGVSADDNHGIGGYERVMGPNGQAQYWAPDLVGAVKVLLTHYEQTYIAEGERFPRRAATKDPSDRDVRRTPHHLPGSPLTSVGDIFDDVANPGRKQPFDIRTVMRAVLDADLPSMERWRDLADGDTAVVWDAHLGGIPVCTIGLEAHAIARRGIVPADGPDGWTSGTLFPMSSWKVARAVNAASGCRPLLVLANLSGFDGSPESMRRRQLEFGAEIGRAAVNFQGPIVFCVVSRYHGGAFVVFSQRLNENLVTLAVEGSHASVIGGAPAAAVVFAGELAKRTARDERVVELAAAAEAATGADRAHLRTQLDELTAEVRSEKLGELAAEFDSIHSVERAREMGSVTEIIPAARLRPELISAVERGMQRELERVGLAR